MPNWCECDLTIEGPTVRVREFLEFARNRDEAEPSDFDFNRFIPYPEEWEEMDRVAALARIRWQELPPEERERTPWPKDGYNSGGYEWCVENWGTKWNAKEPRVEEQYEHEGELTALVMFETAWSPPLPVVKKASELFPDLAFTLKYFEAGAAYNGRYRCEGGAVTYDKSGPYFGDRGG